MRWLRLTFATLLIVLYGPAFAMAAGGGGSDRQAAAPKNPALVAGEAAIAAENWDLAVVKLLEAVEADQENADIYNLLGFAYRSGGNPEKALEYYEVALHLDADHKGAHEYAGTAWLMKGDLARAKFHLAELDRICLFRCAELTSLAEKIAAAGE